MDFHKGSISTAVMNSAGKTVLESVVEAKASIVLQFIDGLRGDLRVRFEQGTWAAWLYDLLKPHAKRNPLLVGQLGLQRHVGCILRPFIRTSPLYPGSSSTRRPL
jgi:hypothetical protein